MSGVLEQLPPFEWRGVKYPVAERDVSFQQEGARHTIQYRDGDFVDNTGAHGLTFSYTLPMRETIAKGPFKHLFEQGLPQLFRDILNREPGPLFDPIYGDFRCVPTMYRDTTDVQKTCGTDIRVEFLFSPEVSAADATVRDLSGVAGLTDNAGALDQQVAKANWHQEPTPEPSVDALQAADGVLSQGMAQVNKASAALDDFAYKMQKLEDTCDRAKDPANWGIRDEARRNREAAIRMNQRLAQDPGAQLRQITVTSPKLLSEFAKEVGMSLTDLLRLNPSLTRFPYVPRGAVVIVIAAKLPPARIAA